jgi:voltage-gated potassium channel Kch
VFGLEEGWPTLDCVYFSIMTLTTIGLGDYVPTTNSAKIVCSIFMYFGIGCFGLLLGLLHANSLDRASKKAAEENMISSCTHCSQEQTMPKATKKSSRGFDLSSPRRRRRRMEPNTHAQDELPVFERRRSLSPVTNRRSTLDTIDERPRQTGWYDAESNRIMREMDGRDSDSSTNSNMSNISIDDRFRPVSQIKAAKYIFLTLKQAFANALFIVFMGSLGFMYFEKVTIVDAFYFTTSMLTTVGYGDIVPKSSGGKVFASGYGIIAWVFLLYNISMISMIPLELRKRRIEHAVLIQFGEDLDEDALHELVSGPLVKRLTGMADTRPNRMDHCTREMFALTMLIRLGRITENDVRSTFSAFQKLDKNNEGILMGKELPRRDLRQQQMNFQEVGNSLPRQRNSNSSLSENSGLLHPLAAMNKAAGDERGNYMSMAAKEDMDPTSRRLMRTRGLSLDSLWSTITDEHPENWDDHP